MTPEVSSGSLRSCRWPRGPNSRSCCVFAGDPEIQTVVARSQQPWRGRQRPTKCPGAVEEQRTCGWSAGMTVTPGALLGYHTHFTHVVSTPLLSFAAEHARWSDPGHELHVSAGQSLAGAQRLLQNVREPEGRLWDCCAVKCVWLWWNNIHAFVSCSTVNTLGVLTGKLLLGMTKDEIRTVCPEEGGKVFFQLQAVKSSIAVGHTTLANTLDTRTTAHQTVTFLPLRPTARQWTVRHVQQPLLMSLLRSFPDHLEQFFNFTAASCFQH